MISSIYKEYNQIQRPDLDYGEERPLGQQKMTLGFQPYRTILTELVSALSRVVGAAIRLSISQLVTEPSH